MHRLNAIWPVLIVLAAVWLAYRWGCTAKMSRPMTGLVGYSPASTQAVPVAGIHDRSSNVMGVNIQAR